MHARTDPLAGNTAMHLSDLLTQYTMIDMLLISQWTPTRSATPNEPEEVTPQPDSRLDPVLSTQDIEPSLKTSRTALEACQNARLKGPVCAQRLQARRGLTPKSVTKPAAALSHVNSPLPW